MVTLCSVFLGVAALCLSASLNATQTAIKAMENAAAAKTKTTESAATLAVYTAASNVVASNLQEDVEEIKTVVKEQGAHIQQILVAVAELKK
jgi:hypothetical protein